MVADNIKAGLMTLFLGSIGDLASRSIWLNCSVDKAWTMLFFLPPLSIISSIMYFLNKVEKGALSCMSAVDIPVFLIPIMTIMLGFLIPIIIGESRFISSFLFIISIFILFAVCRMYRSNKMCKVHFKEKYTKFKSNQIIRAFLISAVANGIISLFNTIAPYLQRLPIVGIGFRLWSYLDIIPGLQHALPLTLLYFIINLYENVPNNLENVCLK